MVIAVVLMLVAAVPELEVVKLATGVLPPIMPLKVVVPGPLVLNPKLDPNTLSIVLLNIKVSVVFNVLNVLAAVVNVMAPLAVEPLAPVPDNVPPAKVSALPTLMALLICMVPPLLAAAVPVPNAVLLPAAKMPLLTLVVPSYVLACESMTVPLPDLFNPKLLAPSVIKPLIVNVPVPPTVLVAPNVAVPE